MKQFILSKPTHFFVNKETYGIRNAFIFGNKDEDLALLLSNAIMTPDTDETGKITRDAPKAFMLTKPSEGEIAEFMKHLIDFIPLTSKKDEVGSDGQKYQITNLKGAIRNVFVENTQVRFTSLNDVINRMALGLWKNDTQSLKYFKAHLIVRFLEATGLVKVTDRVIKVAYNDMVLPTSEVIETEAVRALTGFYYVEEIKKALIEFKDGTGYLVSPVNMSIAIDDAYDRLTPRFSTLLRGFGYRKLACRFLASMIFYGDGFSAKYVTPDQQLFLKKYLNLFVEVAGPNTTKLAKAKFEQTEEYHVQDFVNLIADYSRLPLEYRNFAELPVATLKDWAQVRSFTDYIEEKEISLLHLSLNFTPMSLDIGSVDVTMADSVLGTATKLCRDTQNVGSALRRFVDDLLKSYSNEATMKDIGMKRLFNGSDVNVFSILPDAISATIWQYIAYAMADAFVFSKGQLFLKGIPVRVLSRRHLSGVRYKNSYVLSDNYENFLVLCAKENHSGSLPVSLQNVAVLVPEDNAKAGKTVFAGAARLIKSRMAYGVSMSDLSLNKFSYNFDIVEVLGGVTNSNIYYTNNCLFDPIDTAIDETHTRFDEHFRGISVREKLLLQILADAKIHASNAVMEAYATHGIAIPFYHDAFKNLALMLCAINVYLSTVAIFFPKLAKWLTEIVFDENVDLLEILETQDIQFFIDGAGYDTK